LLVVFDLIFIINIPYTPPYNMATTDTTIDRVEFSDVTAPEYFL